MIRWGLLFGSLAACTYSPSAGPADNPATIDGMGDAAGDAEGAMDGVADTNNGCSNPITFVSSNNAVAGSGNTITVPSPSGVMQDDVLIAAVVFQADSDEQPGTLSTPTAWTLVRQEAFGSNGGIGLATFTRTAIAAEPGTHAFVTSGGSKRFVVNILAYRDVDTANPIADAQSQSAASSTSIVAPSLSAPGCSMLVAAFAIRQATTIEPPVSMAEREDVNHTNGASITLAASDEFFVSAAGTGTRVGLSAAAANQTIGQLIALRPQ